MDNNHHDEEQGLIPVLPQGFSYNSLGSGREENRDDRTTSPNILDIYLAAEQHSFTCTSTFERVCLALIGGVILGGFAGMFAVTAWFTAYTYPRWDNITGAMAEH